MTAPGCHGIGIEFQPCQNVGFLGAALDQCGLVNKAYRNKVSDIVEQGRKLRQIALKFTISMRESGTGEMYVLMAPP